MIKITIIAKWLEVEHKKVKKGMDSQLVSIEKLPLYEHQPAKGMVIKAAKQTILFSLEKRMCKPTYNPTSKRFLKLMNEFK